MQALSQIESEILLFIQNNLRFEFLTPIMVFITRLGDAGLFWIFLTLFMLALKPFRKCGAVCAVSLIFDVVIVNFILKNLFCRVRPYDVFSEIILLVDVQHDWSFPSGHSAASFAVCVVMLKMLPKKFSVPAAVLAVLISFSRLYVGVHYPTDVLAGIAFGTVCALTAFFVCRVLEEKIERRRKNTDENLN